MELSEFSSSPGDRTERVQIYVDGSNLYHGLKTECGNTKLDYLKFSKLLANGRKLVRLNYYDTAILVSGDGDFVEVLEEIKRAGKQVENATFSSSRSDALINAADLFISLSKDGLSDCFR